MVKKTSLNTPKLNQLCSVVCEIRYGVAISTLQVIQGWASSKFCHSFPIAKKITPCNMGNPD